MSPFEMPRLDCHAHIAPDVTPRQIAGLEQALIFAMTRSPAEAAAARRRRSDPTLVWGFGAHPALPSALAELNPSLLSRAVNEHVMIGEVGLDRRGHAASQQAAFEMILQACAGAPVLLSIHSTGRTRQVLNLLEQQPHPGAILHWFNGTPEEIDHAVELGCYFSINNAMTDERINAIPKTRILPETDFPASRKSIRASKPGDIRSLEERLAARGPETERGIRLSWFANLRSLAEAARVLDRLPRAIQSTIENDT